MRPLLIAMLTLLPSLHLLAYDGGEYPDQYDNQGDVYQEPAYQEETYPEESYPEETYPEDSYREEPYQEEPYQQDTAPAEPAYEDPEAAAHLQEIRTMCQEYARDMPPEEQAGYIEDCIRSQGY
ncbi:MAG: hypothetical protein R3F38_08175 [Gammaproteobacteria bacterium]